MSKKTKLISRKRDTPEYWVWRAIKKRCNSPTCKYYDRYGGRGIEVCEEWENSYEAFIAYVGKRPTKEHSIDRIDNDGNYEPGNVKWSTKIEQSNNQTQTIKLSFDGQVKSLATWARELGIRRHTLWCRLYKYGWSVEKALTTTTGKWDRKETV